MGTGEEEAGVKQRFGMGEGEVWVQRRYGQTAQIAHSQWTQSPYVAFMLVLCYRLFRTVQLCWPEFQLKVATMLLCFGSMQQSRVCSSKETAVLLLESVS